MLEASYLVFALQPHYANFNKRLIKAPKIYFYDTGLLCWLLGIREVAQLESHPLRGAIFETYVVAELTKARFNQGERAGLHYWRDSNGNEVDVLAEVGTKLMPIEIKAGQTVNPDFFAALDRWAVLAGNLATTRTVIYGGTNSFLRSGIRILGWNGVANVFS